MSSLPAARIAANGSSTPSDTREVPNTSNATVVGFVLRDLQFTDLTSFPRGTAGLTVSVPKGERDTRSLVWSAR
jgi:hypothetical protein